MTRWMTLPTYIVLVLMSISGLAMAIANSRAVPADSQIQQQAELIRH
jgi:hypothetical protein